MQHLTEISAQQQTASQLKLESCSINAQRAHRPLTHGNVCVDGDNAGTFMTCSFIRHLQQRLTAAETQR